MTVSPAAISLWTSIVVRAEYLPTHAQPFFGFCGDSQNQEKGEAEGG